MKRMIRLLFLLLAPCLGFSQVTDGIITQPTDFSVSPKGTYTVIENKVSSFHTTQVGAPQLPVFNRKYALPAGSIVTGIQVNNGNKTNIGNTLLVYPVQNECDLGGPCDDFVLPDPVIYDSTSPYPAETATVVNDHNLFGYHVVSVDICPFEYIPKNKTLNYYGEIHLTINYTIGPIEYQLRITERRQQLTGDFIKSRVQNPGLLNTIDKTANVVLDNAVHTDKLHIPWKPSEYGDVPDYIIITNHTLESYFRGFATYKTQKGIPTLVTLVEDIYENYPGFDHAEQIRNYLKDAHHYWGAGLYVLLGGDTEVIPGRIGSYYGIQHNYTDLYYSDVYDPQQPNYNWNANGNATFGEDYETTLSPENFIGRAPVDTAAEAENLISKIISYENLTNVTDMSYVNNMLFLGSYYGYNHTTNTGLSISSSGQQWHRQLADKPFLADPALQKWLLFDDYIGLPHHNFPGDEELDRATTLERMSNGLTGIGKFHLVSHYDHGGPYGIGVSGAMKGDHLSREDMDGLSNGSYYQIMYTTGCEDGEFHKDCFAEHYVNAVNTGGVAIMANSGSVSTGGEEQDNTLFQSIYGNLSPSSHIMGLAYTNARMAVPSGLNGYREKQLTLFGEPSMAVWSATPQAIALTVPATVTLSGDVATLPVTINPLTENATVTVYKYNTVTSEAEVFASQDITAGNTTAEFILHPDTPGVMSVKVTAKNYLPATANTNILIPDAHLYVTGYTFTDANNDGSIQQGEAVTLVVSLTNSGGAAISGINTVLTCNPSFVATINTNQVSYGQINAGQTVQLSSYTFVAQVSNGVVVFPDFIEFNLNITASGNYAHLDNFFVELKNPVLKIRTRTMTSSSGPITSLTLGQLVNLNILMQNIGNVATGDMNAVLTSPLTGSGDIVISVPNSTYESLGSMVQKPNSTPFKFTLVHPYTGPLWFTLTLTNPALGTEWAFTFDLNEPLPPLITNFHFTSTKDEIALMWDPVTTNIQGYNIYRSNTENGPYTSLNDFLVTGTSAYTDTAVALTTKYFYKISVVSASGNERALSAVVTNDSPPKQGYPAWTSLDTHGGFPIQAEGINSCQSSATLYDVDQAGDNKKEVFINFERWSEPAGKIMAFRESGEELYNIDGNQTTVAGFVATNIGLIPNSAIGDLNNDGHAEVLSVGRNNNTNEGRLYVYQTIDGDDDNHPDPLWSNDYIDIGHRVWRNPVLYDIDSDGFLDIIVVDEKQEVYVFDHDQNLMPGWPIQAPGGSDYSMGHIAVADLDHDGKAEIALGLETATGTKGGIYIWNHDGTPFTVNPWKLFTDGERADSGIVFADIDNDYNLDILLVTKKSATGRIYAFKQDGTPVNSTWNGTVNFTVPSGDTHLIPRISVGDINHDGNLEVAFGSTNKLFLLNSNGTAVSGFPKNTSAIGDSAPILADIDTDDDAEILFNNGGILSAYNYDGSDCLGFPLDAHESSGFAASPSVDDLDHDGKNEIVIAVESGILFAYKTEGDSDKIEWGSYRGNPHNTGTYKEVCNVPLDLYIKDSADDTGAEPNTVTQYMWTSDNIWVRNNDDDGLEHQNPEYGAPNYVKVRVINKSCVTSTGDETLSMYWAKASAYLSWPDPWNGGISYPGSGASMGEYFGTLNIPVLQPGQEVILTFPWEMPDPALYGDSGDQWHFCLLAEINAEGDPLAVDLTSDLNANVRNNNNQAWKNVTVVDVLPNNSGDSVSGVIAVGNSTESAQVFTLEMLVDALEAADHPIYEDAEVTLEMDDVVYAAWVKGHKRTRFLDPGPKNNIRIVKGNNALLNNLSFGPNEFGTVKFSFHFLTKKITSEKNNYVFNVIQKNFRTQDIIGGERFEINKTERSPFRADAGGDKEVDWNQPLTISAEDIGEPALYNWYDSRGNLIFEGKELRIANAVAENYKLEVISTIDGYKDYADVEVKLKPNRLESISPNPASNYINVNYKLSDAQSAYLMIVSYYINGGVSNNYVLDLHSSQTNINVSNYPYGFYKVVLVVDGQVVDAKLLFKQ